MSSIRKGREVNMNMENLKNQLKIHNRGQELMFRNFDFYQDRLAASAQIAEMVCNKEFSDNRDRIICSLGVNEAKKQIRDNRSMRKN